MFLQQQPCPVERCWPTGRGPLDRMAKGFNSWPQVCVGVRRRYSRTPKTEWNFKSTLWWASLYHSYFKLSLPAFYVASQPYQRILFRFNNLLASHSAWQVRSINSLPYLGRFGLAKIKRIGWYHELSLRTIDSGRNQLIVYLSNCLIFIRERNH